LLGSSAQGFPAGGFRHPEDIDLPVIVAVFQFSRQRLGVGVMQEVVVGLVGKAPLKFCASGGEGIGNVLDEDEAKDKMLVFGCIHVGAQLVGGRPQGFLDVVDHSAGTR